MKSFKEIRQNLSEGVQGIDAISISIPLFIRCMEYAREDAKSDLDLHLAMERMLQVAKTKGSRPLDSNDYRKIFRK
jgi:hypothetical protein